MNKPDSHIKNNKLDTVEEPVTAIEKTATYSSEEEDLHPVLVQLIEKGKRESTLGLGISHEEAMRRIKAKYPFLK